MSRPYLIVKMFVDSLTYHIRSRQSHYLFITVCSFVVKLLWLISAVHSSIYKLVTELRLCIKSVREVR